MGKESAQEQCKSGCKLALPVPNSPKGLCGRKATMKKAGEKKKSEFSVAFFIKTLSPTQRVLSLQGAVEEGRKSGFPKTHTAESRPPSTVLHGAASLNLISAVLFLISFLSYLVLGLFSVSTHRISYVADGVAGVMAV